MDNFFPTGSPQSRLAVKLLHTDHLKNQMSCNYFQNNVLKVALDIFSISTQNITITYILARLFGVL